MIVPESILPDDILNWKAVIADCVLKYPDTKLSLVLSLCAHPLTLEIKCLTKVVLDGLNISIVPLKDWSASAPKGCWKYKNEVACAWSI